MESMATTVRTSEAHLYVSLVVVVVVVVVVVGVVVVMMVVHGTYANGQRGGCM